MKLYIAAHSQEDARDAARKLEAAGHVITARWLNEDFSRTAKYAEDERRVIAASDVFDVRTADALVLLASPTRVPGGKFVEAGVAIGCEKPVYAIGHRENMLMWHPSVSLFSSVEDLVTDLKMKGT